MYPRERTHTGPFAQPAQCALLLRHGVDLYRAGVQRAVDEVLASAPAQVQWSLSIAVDRAVVAEHDPAAVLPTASMGKILLLAEVARQLETGSLQREARIALEPADDVGDSGLLQWMAEPTLSVESLAVLVAGVSDNLATNVLLRTVGLDTVDQLRVEAGLESTRLLDRIRDVRGPDAPPWPSQGSASELRSIFAAIDGRSFVGSAVSARLAAWLRCNADLSMVAAPWSLDPLAHDSLMSKTGADAGVRCDAGALRVGERVATYAVLAHWAADREDELRAPVITAMRSIGRAIGTAMGIAVG